VTDPALTGRVADLEITYRFAEDAVHGGWLGVGATRREVGGVLAPVLAPVTAIAARTRERPDLVDPLDVTEALGAWSPFPGRLRLIDAGHAVLTAFAPLPGDAGPAGAGSTGAGPAGAGLARAGPAGAGGGLRGRHGGQLRWPGPAPGCLRDPRRLGHRTGVGAGGLRPVPRTPRAAATDRGA